MPSSLNSWSELAKLSRSSLTTTWRRSNNMSSISSRSRSRSRSSTCPEKTAKCRARLLALLISPSRSWTPALRIRMTYYYFYHHYCFYCFPTFTTNTTYFTSTSTTSLPPILLILPLLILLLPLLFLLLLQLLPIAIKKNRKKWDFVP